MPDNVDLSSDGLIGEALGEASSPFWINIMEFDNSMITVLCLDSVRCILQLLSDAARDSNQMGDVMDQEENFQTPKLGWTVEELAGSLSVSVPFLRLEVKRGRLKAAHLGRRVVLLDAEVRRYLARANAAEEVGR